MESPRGMLKKSWISLGWGMMMCPLHIPRDNRPGWVPPLYLPVVLHSFWSLSGIECPKSRSQSCNKTIFSQIWYHTLSLSQTVSFGENCDPCFSFLVYPWSVNTADEFVHWNIYKSSSLLSVRLRISRVFLCLWLVSHLVFCTLKSLCSPCYCPIESTKVIPLSIIIITSQWRPSDMN